ncbi:MAG TPA: hypothetical protein VLK84_16225 [Longimicrobium sp.]|nr:hypothetical protein [Longimicrobium sp.]
MSNGPIPAGDIQFYDSYLPLLEAGDYTITAKQQVDSTDAAHPLSTSFQLTQPFSVVAPRFALAPAQVQSVFPPANASGQFTQNLPHVVLMERALPWEREIGANVKPPPANPNVKAYPWMALLVFTADEITPPPGYDPTSSLSNPTLAGTYPVAKLLHPDEAGTMGPPVQPAADDEAVCQAIDIPTDVFTRVTPRLGELPWLSHARQVNTGDKTTSLALTDGWFSVVIANRFPAGTGLGTRNIAHLVSLEGFAPYLVDTPSWPAGVTHVRLASLASWRFTAQPQGGDFRALMLNLTHGQATGGDGLRLRLPVASEPQTPGSPGDLVKKALGQGFAALQYETRVGDETFGWYHGPFVPHQVPPMDAGTGFPSAAAATIYDPTSGTFDLSYAAGWELGRLLALSNRAYGTSMQRARRATRQVVNLVRERTRWNAGQQLLAASPNGDGDGNGEGNGDGGLAALLEPRHVSQGLASWLGAQAAQHLPAAGTPAVGAPQPTNVLLRGGARAPHVTSLQGLHGRADVQSLVQGQTAQALAAQGPLSSVVDFLARLRQLLDVPFVHLVPDARMLPPESIRFFYVDPNYLDALCDGAQSVGVQTSRDAVQQALVRGTVRDGTVARTYALRSVLTGHPLRAANALPNDPVAGFLLRSAVVSGYPGLEVKGFADAAGKVPIDPIRIDHLSPDVLLVLFGQVPARIDVDEPKEGLAFGVEDDQQVGIRALAGDGIGTVTGTVKLDPAYLRGDTRVLAVAPWQTFLGTQVTPQSLWGPAGFALQMVRAPEQMIFDNGSAA